MEAVPLLDAVVLASSAYTHSFPDCLKTLNALDRWYVILFVALSPHATAQTAHTATYRANKRDLQRYAAAL